MIVGFAVVWLIVIESVYFYPPKWRYENIWNEELEVLSPLYLRSLVNFVLSERSEFTKSLSLSNIRGLELLPQ